MTVLPRGVKVHLAFGYIDMRKGIDGLAMLVQGVLRQDPFLGHLFVFRGRKANLIKIVYWDGTGLCLFTKRLEYGVFLWPSNVDPGGTLMLTSAQLSMLIDGIDWRAPERQWRPAVAGSLRPIDSTRVWPVRKHASQRRLPAHEHRSCGFAR
jgi:transposase